MSTRADEIWTVVGAGMAGKSVIGRLGTEGFRLRAHDIDERQIAGMRAAGGLHVEGRERSFAPVELATCDLAAAVDGSSVIIVCTYGNAHAEVAAQLAPLLRDGQTILLLQGNFAGALVFRRALERAGGSARVDVAEMDASPFGVKVLAPDRVLLTGIKARWQLAAAPVARTGAILDQVRPAFPGMVAASSLLETGFSDLGGIFHAGGMITNVGRVEGPESYHFYTSNMAPSVCNLIEAIDAERVAVARAYRVDIPDAKAWLAQTYGLPVTTLHGMLHALAETRYKYAPAPKSLSHRFLAQDVPCVLVPVAEFGRAAGVATPDIDAVIRIASALTGRDFRAEGRNLANLGLDGKDVEGIIAAMS